MTRKFIRIVLFILGILSISYGIYNFFWLKRIEELSSEPGLGGLAVWAITWIFTILGILVVGIGFLISKKNKSRENSR